MSDRPQNATPEPVEDDLPEQMRVRRSKRERLLEDGGAAYPVSVERTHTLAQVRATYDAQELAPDTRTGEQVAVTGRVIFLRNTGKLCFVRLREGDGTELQVMLSLADVGEESLARFKALVDLGDLLAVRGEVVTSRRGELSVQATDWSIAAKTLRPLPNEHKPLSDEARIRLRYVDMMVRPEPRAMVRTKATVLKSLRATLDERSFIEVETPILQLTNGGAAGRTFRNEGLDSTHAAEFSMLEAYEAYGDQHTMIALAKALVQAAHKAIGSPKIIGRDGSEIDLHGEWCEAPILELVSEAVGAPVDVDTDADTLRGYADKHGVELQDQWGAPEIVVELFEQLVEDTLIQPTFVMDYPEEVKPLAKPHRTTAGLNEAWDLVINGVELGAAYSELNDPVIQRERLEEQSRLAAGGDPEAMELDEVFLKAMEYGMPPAGGIGIGVDRLIMLLTGASVRETILFPLVRPE